MSNSLRSTLRIHGLTRSIGTPLFERDPAAILLEDARSEFQPLGLLRTCQHNFPHLLVAFHVAMSFRQPAYQCCPSGCTCLRNKFVRREMDQLYQAEKH